jgi:hypothetical protein
MMENGASTTVFAGAIRLLQECQSVLTTANVDCIVMGGWNALLYKKPERVHPRTFDVDLLLPPKLSRNKAEALIRAFIANGFSQSAKHAFQLIREVDLCGTRFAFNVDLLHPFLESTYPEMFVDLMSHDIALSDFDRSTMNFSKSIVLPGVDEIMWNRHSKRQLSLNEANTCYEISALFPDPVAFICSKALALGGKKRPRDAYDIFLTLEGQGVEECTKVLYELAKTSPTARKCLETLREFMQEPKISAGKTNRFLSSFRENSFFQKLSCEDQASYLGDGQHVVDKFLKATDMYPQGMKIHD